MSCIISIISELHWKVMAERLYSLKWGNHENSLAQAFKSLKSDGGFCDVTIACENRILETHKLVLATSSSVFNSILRC